MSETSAAKKTAPEDRVPIHEKFVLGIGGLPFLFGSQGLKTLAIPFYQMTLGINPATLGLALALPRLWDAFTDPVMGKISDNFHSKWGRRRPFIFIGAILMGIAFGAIWMVPSTWSENAMLSYFIVTMLIFYTCYTMFTVPIISLMYEMTPDYNERTRVTAFWTVFIKIASSVYAWIFPLAQLLVTVGLAATIVGGVRYVGWGVGILILGGLGILPAIFTKERYFKKVEKQKKVKLTSSFKESFKNPAFTFLVLISLSIAAAGMLTSNLDYYLLVYYMNDGDIGVGSYWKGILSTAYAVCGFVSIYPLVYICNWLGKQKAMMLVFGMCIVGGFLKWFIYVPGNTWQIILDPIMCAPIYVGMGMISQSMMADVCDDDEWKYGARREGMFGAIYSWVTKFGYSFAFLVSGIALNWVGFDVDLGGNQTPETFTGMRLCVAGGAVISATVGLIIVCFYPITKKRANETRKKLEERRGKITS